MGAVVALFEDPAYSPDNAVLGARVVTLMNEVRACLGTTQRLR